MFAVSEFAILRIATCTCVYRFYYTFWGSIPTLSFLQIVSGIYTVNLVSLIVTFPNKLHLDVNLKCGLFQFLIMRGYKLVKVAQFRTQKENLHCENARCFQFGDLWAGASMHSLRTVRKHSNDALLKVSSVL